MRKVLDSKKYRLVLGLEIHMHVKTDRKMFCTCSTNDIYNAAPNTHTCPVCLGLPGALPVPNRQAIEKTQQLGLALNCSLNRQSRFDRKHYFYPDLPKGYQISQYKQPFCKNGYLDLSPGARIDIERIHLEEDTAKSFHEGGKTLLDFNKSGVALIEMVTTPCIHSVDDAVSFCKQIQEIVRHLGISDAHMEKGQLRIEPNISLRTPEMEEAGELANYKVEVKNINSFKFMERAVKAEMVRQQELLDKGVTPKQENRGFNESTGKTVLQRSKEEAHDYRYFPEPDIPPFEFSDEHVKKLKAALPLLPSEIKETLSKEYGASKKDANVLYTENLGQKLEKIVKKGVDSKTAVNLLVNRPEYREKSVEDFVKAVEAAASRIEDTSALEPAVEKVLKEHAAVVDEIREGKEAAMEFLLGMVMRETKGKAAPEVVRKLLRSKIHG